MTTFTSEDYEMAAKAAGLQEWGWMADTLTHVVDNQFVFWNPPEDDGDALRLAAKLELTIHTHRLTMSASRFGKVEYFGGWVDRTFDNEEDYRACIFRAAIAIGRAMP